MIGIWVQHMVSPKKNQTTAVIHSPNVANNIKLSSEAIIKQVIRPFAVIFTEAVLKTKRKLHINDHFYAKMGKTSIYTTYLKS